MVAQFTLTQILLMGGVLFLAGMTKGLLGVGLPLLAVPLLSLLVPVPTAIMMLAVSTLVSNGFQAFQGRSILTVTRRYWSLIVPFIITIFVATRFLLTLHNNSLSFILGTTLVFFTLLNQFRHRLQIDSQYEKILNPIVGVVAGFIGGISSFYGPVLMVYMVALKLPKALFVSTMSTLLFVGALPLILSLVVYGLMRQSEFTMSVLGLIPVFAGLLIGQSIQRRIPEQRFQNALAALLFLTGVSLVIRAL